MYISLTENLYVRKVIGLDYRSNFISTIEEVNELLTILDEYNIKPVIDEDKFPVMNYFMIYFSFNSKDDENIFLMRYGDM